MRAALKLHRDVSGRGPPLVLLHGWGSHSGVWSALLPQLASHYEVHAVDLPGFGLSPDPAPESFDEAAQGVAAVVPRDAIVCGWSLGGLFAQWIAAREPGRARSLVLVGATPCFVQRPDWPCAMPRTDFDAFCARVEHDPPQSLDYFAGLSAWGEARHRDVARELRARIHERSSPPRDALMSALGWLRETDLRASVDAIESHTLVVHGAGDAIVPAAAGRWLAQRIPGTIALELPDAGHAPFASRPEAFVEALETLRCTA